MGADLNDRNWLLTFVECIDSMNPEELRDIIGWDIANWSQALPFWEQHLPRETAGLTMLEIGGGDGGLSIFFGRKGMRVTCSDFGGPNEIARSSHEKYGLASVEYADIDATEIAFPDSSFDVVAFKSVLGAIAPDGTDRLQRKVIDEIHRVLKPGGVLLFVENMVGTPAHKYLRRRLRQWGAMWRYPSIEEFEEFCEEFESLDWRTCGVMGALGNTERKQRLLSVVDRVLGPFLPDSMKYIFIGAARKRK